MSNAGSGQPARTGYGGSFLLGARRMQLIREVLLEAICLAIPGGLRGLMLSAWGSDLFRQAAAKLPRSEEIRLDWRIVLFTLALRLMRSSHCPITWIRPFPSAASRQCC